MVTAIAVAIGTVWSSPVALAQNSPPNKPESDCGVTTMCLDPPAPPLHHGQPPLWAAELVMFAVVAAVLLLAYRLLLLRRPR